MTTPSQAKNAIGKALREIIDPPLSESDKRCVREFFDNKCAYCGSHIPPDARTGHMDHLIPRNKGGTNHRSNIILSCNICNGDKKLDLDWKQFLASEFTDSDTHAFRRINIEKWISAQGGPVTLTDDLNSEIQASQKTISTVLDLEIARLKRIRSRLRANNCSARQLQSPQE